MTGLFERVTGSNDTDDPEDEVETADCSIEEACMVLSNERRRVLIRHVATLDATERVTISDLADYVSDIETDGRNRKAVYVGIYQTHAENLVDVDVLIPKGEHDSGVFCVGPNATPLACAIDELDARTGGAQ